MLIRFLLSVFIRVGNSMDVCELCCQLSHLRVSVTQRLGRRTSDLAVMGSIPGPGVIRHLGQLSLPSLRGRQIEYQPSPVGVKARCVLLCRVASNIV